MFFLMLLTLEVSANEVTIVAKVNQTPITSYDVEMRTHALQVLIPNFEKYTNEEKQQIALQNLIQDALKEGYIEKSGFVISQEDERRYQKAVVKMLAMQGVPNLNRFVENHQDFVISQTRWQVVMERNFAKNINITQEMIDLVKKTEMKLTEVQIREILTQKQLESYSNQALESIKKVSIIEVIG